MNSANQASCESAATESTATQAMRSERHNSFPAHSRNAAPPPPQKNYAAAIRARITRFIRYTTDEPRTPAHRCPAHHTGRPQPLADHTRRVALAAFALLAIPFLAPAVYAQTDTTPPTVTSVRFYNTEAHAITGTADNTITEAQIGNSVYVSIQFSENMRNVNHTITPFVQGIPRITQKYIEPQQNRVETLQNQIIAHDAAFPDFISRCRAASAPPTDRYLCRVLLLSTQHAVAPLTIVMPGEDNRVTDVAGNELAAEYTSPN